MLNYVWLFLAVSAVIIGGINGHLKELTDGIVKGAETAVTVAIGLIGIMALWLGIMRIAEKSGLVKLLANFLQPVFKFLFPDVPKGHPAISSMTMNIAANMLGLSNAATPLGLRAMKDLQSLNPTPDTATNAMCTFLAINTSSVQLIPMTAVAILASAGSKYPTAIVGTSLLATFCSTLAGIGAVKWMEKWRIFRLNKQTTNQNSEADKKDNSIQNNSAIKDCDTDTEQSLNKSYEKPLSIFGRVIMFCWLLFFVFLFAGMASPELIGWGVRIADLPQPFLARAINAISLLAIPFLVTFFPLYATLKGVKVYEEFVIGAKEGFEVAVRIIPYLVAILVAIGMFRGAGGIELLSKFFGALLSKIGFPVELLPMALMRPLSGSATLGIFSDLVKQYGPDSLIARMAGTLYGSTETTFYVVAIYFGSVNIRRFRHSVAAGLIADLVGVIAAVIICKYMFG